jgi:hypothetical protein
MPKTVNVRVTTVEAELEFGIQATTTGKQLFDQVAKTLGIRETWYFGLAYVDSTGLEAWLTNEKKVSSHDVKKETPMRFRFRVRFYPEDVAQELIQKVTRQMFYLQVKEAIIRDEIYCPPETAVLLASYILQAKHGDYDRAIHKQGFVASDKVLPARVISQHTISKEQWEERIVTWYEEHRGMHRDDAMMEFLKIAQDLEMYGVTYFEIYNKKGTALFLGIDALGINVYEKSDKLTPRIGFPWSEIRNVSFSNKKFLIKPTDRKSPDFVFYSGKMVVNKRILELCMGNHEQYMRRRKPESIEIQQMKAQAKEERAGREAERSLLEKEKKEREEAEKKRRELEEQLARYTNQFENAKKELELSQRAARSLEERMEAAERERHELELAQHRAEEARRLAEESASLEKAERELKEREAAMAQELLEEKLQEARLREEEAERLHRELEEARHLMEENQRALEEARNARPTIITTVIEANHNAAKRSSISSSGSSRNDEYEHNLEPDSPEQSHELPVYENAAGNYHPEEDRITEAEKNERINKQLKTLSAELEESKLRNAVTPFDVIYRQNVAQGRNKYQTLKQIRQGNTKHRVDIFEAM